MNTRRQISRKGRKTAVNRRIPFLAGISLWAIAVVPLAAEPTANPNSSERLAFLVDRVTFEDQGRDGVHVNGPASYGVIRHVRGVTYDDFIALNAWDWRNYAPTFGPIDHVLVDDAAGGVLVSPDSASPLPDGTAEVRLLPGTKNFPDGVRVDCDISDCVFRGLANVRTVKMYDQPNLELGRDNDFADPIGTARRVYFSRLVFNRPGRFQIAVNVDGLAIDHVQLRFAEADTFTLVEIGPMSATCQHGSDDPSRWVELFSPDRDVTVRNFHLSNVRVESGGTLKSVSAPENRLVKATDQKLNPEYPKTTPRGGTGKGMWIR